MEIITGSALVSEKSTTLKIIISGTTDGIINNLDYKLFCNNNEIFSFLDSIKIGVVGVSATEVLEEITAENILENIELSEEDLYIASLIETAIRKSLIEYLQVQINVQPEPTYEE